MSKPLPLIQRLLLCCDEVNWVIPISSILFWIEDDNMETTIVSSLEIRNSNFVRHFNALVILVGY